MSQGTRTHHEGHQFVGVEQLQRLRVDHSTKAGREGFELLFTRFIEDVIDVQIDEFFLVLLVDHNRGTSLFQLDLLFRIVELAFNDERKAKGCFQIIFFVVQDRFQTVVDRRRQGFHVVQIDFALLQQLLVQRQGEWKVDDRHIVHSQGTECLKKCSSDVSEKSASNLLRSVCTLSRLRPCNR